MVRHRTGITRIIAAVLTVAFSAQVAGAQLVNCSGMKGVHTTHASMMQQTHSADAAGAVAAHSGNSHHRAPGTMGCDPTMLCVNHVAVPVVAMRAFLFNDSGPQVSFGRSVPSAHTVPPELPPPRL